MPKALNLNLAYILGSILYGPLSLMLGFAQTSGGGDTADSSYDLPDGTFDYATRDAEFQRAGLVTAFFAGIGIVLGIASLISLLALYKKKSISVQTLIVRGLLTLVMISGYVLAIIITFEGLNL